MPNQSWHITISHHKPVAMFKHSDKVGKFIDCTGSLNQFKPRPNDLIIHHLHNGYMTGSHTTFWARHQYCQLARSKRQSILSTQYAVFSRISPDVMVAHFNRFFRSSFMQVPTTFNPSLPR